MSFIAAHLPHDNKRLDFDLKRSEKLGAEITGDDRNYCEPSPLLLVLQQPMHHLLPSRLSGAEGKLGKKKALEDHESTPIETGGPPHIIFSDLVAYLIIKRVQS